jgi:hypothetical protein
MSQSSTLYLNSLDLEPSSEQEKGVESFISIQSSEEQLKDSESRKSADDNRNICPKGLESLDIRKYLNS